MDREERVVKSVPTKDNLVASGKLIDRLENLIPGVLRHEADERIQTDDGLLIEMVKNGSSESIGIWTLMSQGVNIRN